LEKKSQEPDELWNRLYLRQRSFQNHSELNVDPAHHHKKWWSSPSSSPLFTTTTTSPHHNWTITPTGLQKIQTYEYQVKSLSVYPHNLPLFLAYQHKFVSSVRESHHATNHQTHTGMILQDPWISGRCSFSENETGCMFTIHLIYIYILYI
jgi:hypothetical protein